MFRGYGNRRILSFGPSVLGSQESWSGALYEALHDAKNLTRMVIGVIRNESFHSNELIFFKNYAVLAGKRFLGNAQNSRRENEVSFIQDLIYVRTVNSLFER